MARLTRSLERTLRSGHPWVYRDAIEGLSAEPGDVVTVQSPRGQFVGRGFADEGPIAVRLVTTRDEPVAENLMARRFQRAAELRDLVVPERTTAYRLVHGEGDRLPGMVVDVYGDTAVWQFDGLGASRWGLRAEARLRETLEARGVRALLLRTRSGSHPTVRALWGAWPEDPTTVKEYGMTLLASLKSGQKTGLFLDHRESRRQLRTLSSAKRVLNLYGYTGGFSVAAGLGGAHHVTTVDIAAPALHLANESWRANGLAADRHDSVDRDVPRFLEEAGSRAFYDVIVADSPSFAPRESARSNALKAYETLHRRVLDHLVPGGLYLAASCSSHVDGDAFDETLRAGARRAGRVLQVVGRWGAAPDHPHGLAFPEGNYLKVRLLRSVD